MPGIIIPTAKNSGTVVAVQNTFGHIEKDIPAWRKKLGFYDKTEYFKMIFVSTADPICPQTQKNEKFWVLGVFFTDIEKITDKMLIFS